MKVLICGDRNWNHPEDIDAFVKTFPKDSVIIEGECSGADIQAKTSAIRLGLKVEPYPANWNKYGKKAGVLRNTQMLEEGKPHLVIAFHDDLSKSKGTLNMVIQAYKKNVPFKIVSHNPNGIKINTHILKSLKIYNVTAYAGYIQYG